MSDFCCVYFLSLGNFYDTNIFDKSFKKFNKKNNNKEINAWVKRLILFYGLNLLIIHWI